MRVMAVVGVMMGIALPWAGGSAGAAEVGGPSRVEPAPVVAASTAATLRCLGTCADEYGRCVQRDEAKHPGICGSTAMRCRNRCPQPSTAPSRVEREAGQPAGRVDEVERSGSAALKKRRRAAAASAKPPTTTRPAQDAAIGSSGRTVSGVAAPERAPEPQRAVPSPTPAAPQGATAMDERAATSAARPPGKDARVGGGPAADSAAAPPGHTDSTGAGDAPPAGGTTSAPGAAPEPAPERGRRRNFLATAWCVFHRCDAAVGNAPPRTCREECADDYDACTAEEDVKRPGTKCSAELMRCNARCKGTAP